jgi:hypothetical protein
VIPSVAVERCKVTFSHTRSSRMTCILFDEYVYGPFRDLSIKALLAPPLADAVSI